MHLKTKPSTQKRVGKVTLPPNNAVAMQHGKEGGRPHHKSPNTKWKGNKRAVDAPENKALHIQNKC